MFRKISTSKSRIKAALRDNLFWIIVLMLGSVGLWLSGWGLFLWSVCTKALPEDVGFGYYKEFSAAKKQIERSQCAESIGYARHEDITLEDFHFQILTNSKLVVQVWFFEGMNIEKICSAPEGIVAVYPNDFSHKQSYSKLELQAQGIELTNLNDLLCNVEQLSAMLERNYKNEAIPRVRNAQDPNFFRYLHIEVLGKEPALDTRYTKIH